MARTYSTGRIIGIVVLALFCLSTVIGGAMTLASMSAFDDATNNNQDVDKPSNTVLGTLGGIQLAVALAAGGLIYWLVKTAPQRLDMSAREASARAVAEIADLGNDMRVNDIRVNDFSENKLNNMS